ncbi:alpha/beta fold hydrolase [Sphingomonas sp. Y38-1Y]|uniref:alpha/beta fold hydrolase n=1 Tax=Sphingomonas sp. Y38-1Y TaxID=3078265 RepID=UPI0028EFCEF9|nr:alpha/beta fold hydrolase [Sphingomonas sp. Y38-1Y]
MTDQSTMQHLTAADGTRLAWHELGEGRPIVLIHGYMSSADVNWMRWGHAGKVAAEGYRVIMPDLRAHGQSDRPHDAAAYYPDVLAEDAEALIAKLGLTDYDLGGYSLGARTTMRVLDRAKVTAPAKVIFVGMGYEGLIDTDRRSGHFRGILDNLGTFERGSPKWMVEAFLKTTKGDPVALRHILDTFVDTAPERVAAITQPTLVLAGEEDDDNGSHRELAAAIPGAALKEVPGGHMSAVTKPELGDALAEWLAAK